MANRRKSAPEYGCKPTTAHAALTSDRLILGRGAPKPHELLSALDCLDRCAARVERSESYADHTIAPCLSRGLRLDILCATIVLAFKNAGADTVWDAVEYILVPLISGLCEGKHQTGNLMGTGMVGSDGRDHLRDLERDEGEPLSRIIDAIARHCPQILNGHPESSDD